MSVPLLHETFLIRGNLSEFKGWIESWRIARHPDSSHMVHHQIEADNSRTLYWYVPNEMGKMAEVARIAINLTHMEAELLEAKLSYADDIEIRAYVMPLIEGIQSRWIYQGDSPDFGRLISDSELSELLNARWAESQRAFQASAYLSTMILLGSILEGMLWYKIQSNREQAGGAKSAPKDRAKNVRPFDDWTLDSMITVAHECGWLDKDVHSYAGALREYRNLIHPREQVRSRIVPDKDSCRISWPVVEDTF